MQRMFGVGLGNDGGVKGQAANDISVMDSARGGESARSDGILPDAKFRWFMPPPFDQPREGFGRLHT